MLEESKRISQFEPYWDDTEKQAVMQVMQSGYLNEHKTVREFERRFAEFVGARYCVTVTSGTISLYVAIKAAEMVYGRQDDYCVVPDYAGIFAANAAKQVGMIPILSDVTKNGSMVQNGKQSIIVHSNGRLGKPLKIEDSCQAISHHTKGAVSCYSFASTKHLTTFGQGGAVCCDDDELFDRLTRIKDHGRNDRQKLKPMSDNFESWGTNFKFTEAQAAFGLAQLAKLRWRLDRLDKMYGIVRDVLDKVEDVAFLEGKPTWYLDILVPDPQKVIDGLAKNNIQARRFYKPLHRQPLYQREGKFPNSDYLYDHGLWLPSTTNLTDEDVIHVCEKINEVIKDG